MSALLNVSLVALLAVIAFAIIQLFFSPAPVGFENTRFTRAFEGKNVTFARDDNGVMHFWAPDRVR